MQKKKQVKWNVKAEKDEPKRELKKKKDRKPKLEKEHTMQRENEWMSQSHFQFLLHFFFSFVFPVEKFSKKMQKGKNENEKKQQT